MADMKPAIGFIPGAPSTHAFEHPTGQQQAEDLVRTIAPEELQASKVIVAALPCPHIHTIPVEPGEFDGAPVINKAAAENYADIPESPKNVKLDPEQKTIVRLINGMPVVFCEECHFQFRVTQAMFRDFYQFLTTPPTYTPEEIMSTLFGTAGEGAQDEAPSEPNTDKTEEGSAAAHSEE